jgi:hypothetical protein
MPQTLFIPEEPLVIRPQNEEFNKESVKKSGVKLPAFEIAETIF